MGTDVQHDQHRRVEFGRQILRELQQGGHAARGGADGDYP